MQCVSESTSELRHLSNKILQANSLLPTELYKEHVLQNRLMIV
jgi:hypothetical protein